MEGIANDESIFFLINALLSPSHRLYKPQRTTNETHSPIVVEVDPLRNFYPADAYHQDYLDKHPDGYCHISLDLFRIAREW